MTAAVVLLAVALVGVGLVVGLVWGLWLGASHAAGVEEMDRWQAEHRDRLAQWRERQFATVLAFAVMVSQSGLRKGRQMAAALLRWLVPPATPKRRVPPREPVGKPTYSGWMDGIYEGMNR